MLMEWVSLFQKVFNSMKGELSTGKMALTQIRDHDFMTHVRVPTHTILYKD